MTPRRVYFSLSERAGILFRATRSLIAEKKPPFRVRLKLWWLFPWAALPRWKFYASQEQLAELGATRFLERNGKKKNHSNREVG